MAHLTDWQGLSAPNAEWEAAMSKAPARPNLGAFGNDMPALRKYMAGSRRKMVQSIPETPGISIADHQVVTRDGANIICRVYTPDGKVDCPLSIVYHGGGWCVGGLDNEELLCKALAGELGCVAINVDYRLAPENPYPVPINDCYDAAKWAISQAKFLHANPAKGLTISGTSAGANMAAIVALMLRDEKLSQPVSGVHLIVPAVCVPAVMPNKYKADHHSWEQNKDADILNRSTAELFLNNYVPDIEVQKSTQLNPLIWSTGLKGFPPTYFQICGADPLRDEALIFERVLRVDESIKTKVDVYPGLPHSFWSAVPVLKVSQQFRLDSVAGLKWLLA